MRRRLTSRGPNRDSRAGLLDLLILIYFFVIWGIIFSFYLILLLIDKSRINNWVLIKESRTLEVVHLHLRCRQLWSCFLLGGHHEGQRDELISSRLIDEIIVFHLSEIVRTYSSSLSESFKLSSWGKELPPLRRNLCSCQNWTANNTREKEAY